ncbi:MAG: hypothetical protein AAGD22_11320 [Verrucomicrobiota bacterium]
MKLQDIKDVLSFAAFRPDADDSSSSCPKRFPGQRYLLLNVSRDHVSWRAVGKKGEFEGGDSMEGDLRDVAPQMSEDWKAMTDSGHVVVSINNRFVISLEHNLSRRGGYQELIRSNPKAVLGAKCDRGKRYAVHHNPETSASLLLACDDSLVKSVEENLSASGLKPARVCCGLYAMMTQYLHDFYRQKPNDRPQNMVLLACCEGSVGILNHKGGQWSEFRARSGVYQEEIEPVAQLTSKFFQEMAPGTPVVFLNDRRDTPFAQRMLEGLKNFAMQDATQSDHLWTVIGKS